MIAYYSVLQRRPELMVPYMIALLFDIISITLIAIVKIILYLFTMNPDDAAFTWTVIIITVVVISVILFLNITALLVIRAHYTEVSLEFSFWLNLS